MPTTNIITLSRRNLPYYYPIKRMVLVGIGNRFNFECCVGSVTLPRYGLFIALFRG